MFCCHLRRQCSDGAATYVRVCQPHQLPLSLGQLPRDVVQFLRDVEGWAVPNLDAVGSELHLKWTFRELDSDNPIAAALVHFWTAPVQLCPTRRGAVSVLRGRGGRLHPSPAPLAWM